MKTRNIGWQRGDTTGTRQPTLIAPSAHSQTKPPWICRCSSAHIMWPGKKYLGGAPIYMIIYICVIYMILIDFIYVLYLLYIHHYTVLKQSLKQYLRTSKSPLTVGCHYHETIKLIKHLEEKKKKSWGNLIFWHWLLPGCFFWWIDNSAWFKQLARRTRRAANRSAMSHWSFPKHGYTHTESPQCWFGWRSTTWEIKLPALWKGPG